MRVISLAVLAVLVCAVTALGSMSIEDRTIAYSSSSGVGGQLAVERARYKPSGDSLDSHNLIAVAGGDNTVKIYTFTSASGFTFRETITLSDSDLRPFDISIVPMDIDDDGADEHCLVMPSIDVGSSNSGDIAIFDLEGRVLYENCLDWNGYTAGAEVYHLEWVAEYSSEPTKSFSVSISNGIGQDYIYLATLDHSGLQPEIKLISQKSLPGSTYYASSTTAGARPYETYPIEINGDRLAMTTIHNCGLEIWDPTDRESYSRIRVSQQGGSAAPNGYGSPMLVDGELGDVHRAFLLRDGFDDPCLVFLSNHTMGMTVYDIHDLEDPLFVWQWDNDTRLKHTVGGSVVWDWHGAGDGDSVAPAQGEGIPYNPPGCAFGIGGRYDTSGGLIHIFLADGGDGLRAFDFSSFFNPFDLAGVYEYSAFDNYYTYSESPQGESPRLAYDLRTLEIPDEPGVFVFTSWREHKDTSQSSEIRLTAHHDDNSLDGMAGGAGLVAEAVISLAHPSPNPSSGSVTVEYVAADRPHDITIFDMTGRVVDRESIESTPGTASFRWDGCDQSGEPVPSGVYVMRFRDTEGRAVSRQFSLLR